MITTTTGMRVRIVNGEFAGVEGEVIDTFANYLTIDDGGETPIECASDCVEVLDYNRE